MEENKKPSNPQAFPQNWGVDGKDDWQNGMDLRDYFAAKAMQGILAGIYQRGETASPDEMFERFELVSKNAYWFADSMLKQREQ